MITRSPTQKLFFIVSSIVYAYFQAFRPDLNATMPRDGYRTPQNANVHTVHLRCLYAQVYGRFVAICWQRVELGIKHLKIKALKVLKPF
jgi:hypothetical protein